MSKSKKSSLIIIALILLINLFWLPSFSFWKFYPHGQLVAQKLPALFNYQKPSTAIVTKAAPPQTIAQAYIIIDPKTNQIIASKNPHQHIFPASTTKLATAITALNIYPLDELVTVNQEYKEGKIMELQLNEKITVRALVDALLVYSANDAAYTLASHHQKGIEGFVNEMNHFAQKYYLTDTHFTGVDGIHNPNHYSSVYDLSQFARLAIKNQTVREVVKQKNLTVSDITNSIQHELTTTNELLGVVPEIEGLKTGWTPEAGGSFVGLINLNGHYLVTVVAASEDRFGDTRNLIDWTKANVTWQN